MQLREQRAESILDASLAVFCRYGFRKSSMQDIAKECGISRAALYLHFNSKEDVFRAGSQRAHAQVMRLVNEELLSANKNVLGRIENALFAFMQGLMSEISSSPHGAELFAVNLELAGEIAKDARGTLLLQLKKNLSDAEEKKEISLKAAGISSMELARLCIAAMDGIKHTHDDAMQQRKAVTVFIQVLRAALHQAKK
jgi:AcrR family transcriptional regulator